MQHDEIDDASVCRIQPKNNDLINALHCCYHTPNKQKYPVTGCQNLSDWHVQDKVIVLTSLNIQSFAYKFIINNIKKPVQP